VLTSRIRPRGIRQTGSGRALLAGCTDLLVRGPTTTGLQQTLACNASTRVAVLTIVSAIDILTRPVRSFRGWPYLRLRELRVCAALFVTPGGTCSASARLFGAAHPTNSGCVDGAASGLATAARSSDKPRVFGLKAIPSGFANEFLVNSAARRAFGQLAQWCDYQERHSGFGHRPAVRT